MRKNGIQMTQAEREELVEIEAQARYHSTRVAYAVGAVIVLLGLATTPMIRGEEGSPSHHASGSTM